MENLKVLNMSILSSCQRLMMYSSIHQQLFKCLFLKNIAQLVSSATSLLAISGAYTNDIIFILLSFIITIGFITHS